jgi:LysR family hydrogen peroxide-inducible transcriptional activator
MEPTLRQLRYFVALAETQHFGQAALHCHVSQPALSMQIKELERELGVPLIERAHRGALLTPAGIEVARRARAILQSARDLADVARQHVDVLSGPLRVGVIPTIGPYLLPSVLPRLHEAFPSLQLSLRETQTLVLVRELLAGSLDLLILALPLDEPEIEQLPLFDDVFALALPARHPLGARADVAQADLSGEHLLLLEEGHCLRDQTLAVGHAAGASELGDFRASSLATVVQMVANGYGCTILPELALPVEVGDRQGIHVVAFKTPPPVRTVGQAWRRTSPRRNEFIAFGQVVVEAARQAADRRLRAPAGPCRRDPVGTSVRRPPPGRDRRKTPPQDRPRSRRAWPCRRSA